MGAEHAARRIPWACRRGLLELDLWLAPLARRSVDLGAEDSARCKIENALILGMKTMSPKERAFISTQIMRPSLRFGRLGHPSPPKGQAAPHTAETAAQVSK